MFLLFIYIFTYQDQGTTEPSTSVASFLNTRENVETSPNFGGCGDDSLAKQNSRLLVSMTANTALN